MYTLGGLTRSAIWSLYKTDSELSSIGYTDAIGESHKKADEIDELIEDDDDIKYEIDELISEEICRYIKEVELTPLNPWYSALHNMTSDGKFMSQFYLTFNEFGVIEPDYDKINTLIKEPTPEDFPK